MNPRRVLAAVAVGAAAVPLALPASGSAVRQAGPLLWSAELKSVGDGGISGRALARKDGSKLVFQATLSCSPACRDSVEVRFALTRGACGRPSSRTVSLGGGTLGARGLEVRRQIPFVEGADYRAVVATWDRDGDRKFEPVACGFVLMQYFGLTAPPKRFTLTVGSSSCTREISSGKLSCVGTSAAKPTFAVSGNSPITLSARLDTALPRGWYVTIVDLPNATKCDSRQSSDARGCSARVGPFHKRLHTIRGRMYGGRSGESFFLSIEFQQTG